MHKVCYITTQNLGIIYWRVENFAQWLFEHRDKTKVYPFVEYLSNPNKTMAWEAIIEKDIEQSEEMRGKLEGIFNYFDSVIIQRMNYSAGIRFLDYLMKKYPKVKVYMEIDDNIGSWTPSNYHINQITDQDNCAAIQAKMSHGVICSTEKLAEETKWLNSNVVVIQNCIYPKLFHYKNCSKNNLVKSSIAYIAGGGHDEDLLIAYRGWKLIPDELKPKFVIRYGGFRPSYLEDHELIDFKLVDWHISEYPQKLSEVGATTLIAPLRDTVFNRSKSNIKILESSEIDTPIITSRVGPYKTCEHEKHIVCGNSPEEWRDSIIYAIKADWKKTKKNSFKYTMRKKYNIGKECNKLISFLIADKK